VRKIITLVDTWKLKYSPHCDGGLNALANFHLYASASPHVMANAYHEFDPGYPYEKLLTHPPIIKDGKAIVSDRPGLGSDLLDGLDKKFPYKSDTWFVRKYRSGESPVLILYARSLVHECQANTIVVHNFGLLQRDRSRRRAIRGTKLSDEADTNDLSVGAGWHYRP
jgi:hypothetical protein